MAWIGAEDEARFRAWMTEAQQGDREAFERLLTELLPLLRRTLRGRLRDDAALEDTVQSVLVAVFRARHTYRAERPFGPWLRAVARNASLDTLRDRSRRLEREAPIEAADPVSAPEPIPLHEPLSPRMIRALSSLPDGQRQAVEMLYLRGMSVAEAAERVGISRGALKVRAHRGTRALREHLSDPQEER